MGVWAMEPIHVWGFDHRVSVSRVILLLMNTCNTMMTLLLVADLKWPSFYNYHPIFQNYIHDFDLLLRPLNGQWTLSVQKLDPPRMTLGLYAFHIIA